jgi:hypothetical protein
MLWLFKYFRRKIRRKNWHFWLKTKLNYANFDHNIGFWEKRQFFRRKLSKIAENCDNNVDPWSPCTTHPWGPAPIREQFANFTARWGDESKTSGAAFRKAYQSFWRVDGRRRVPDVPEVEGHAAGGHRAQGLDGAAREGLKATRNSWSALLTRAARFFAMQRTKKGGNFTRSPLCKLPKMAN